MREPARPKLNSGAAPDGRAAPTVTSLATQKALDRGQDWLPTRSVSTPSRIDAAQAIHTLMLTSSHYVPVSGRRHHGTTRRRRQEWNCGRENTCRSAGDVL